MTKKSNYFLKKKENIGLFMGHSKMKSSENRGKEFEDTKNVISFVFLCTLPWNKIDFMEWAS